jgi:CPA2 family monovalent cation:H+ antiporter-2
MIGITLVEDFAVVVMTVLLPALGPVSPGGRLAVLARDIGKALVILIPLIVLAMRWVPSLMLRIARMRNPELYVLVVLALGLTTAAITQTLGLSLALGAFVAGMIVSETEVAHETLQRLQPLRDAFVSLFFVTVGALVDPRALLKSPGLLSILVGLIVVGKFVVWSTVVRVFRYSGRIAILAGAGLTQIGEFSYVLVQLARQERVVGEDVYNAVLAASLLTILLNAALIRWVPALLNRRGMAS